MAFSLLNLKLGSILSSRNEFERRFEIMTCCQVGFMGIMEKTRIQES